MHTTSALNAWVNLTTPGTIGALSANSIVVLPLDVPSAKIALDFNITQPSTIHSVVITPVWAGELDAELQVCGFRMGGVVNEVAPRIMTKGGVNASTQVVFTKDELASAGVTLANIAELEPVLQVVNCSRITIINSVTLRLNIAPTTLKRRRWRR